MFLDVSMGIGPFMWADDQQVGVDIQRFERNPNYFIRELPYLDELVVHGILDESNQLAAQLAHQTDWHWVRNWDQYRSYVDHDEIKTVIGATRGHLRLWINPRNEPFDNLRIRQAIVMGIDRKAAIRYMQEGYGLPGGFGYAPGSPWELPQEQLCSVPGWCVSEDMDATRGEARAILVSEGFDFGKTYVMYLESDEQVHVLGMFLQEQLRMLGVKTDFEIPNHIPRLRPYRPHQWSDFIPRSSTVPADDPNEGVAKYLLCDSYYNLWTPDGPCDEHIESLLEKSRVEPDPVKRLDLAHQIELAAMKQYGSFPVFWEQEAAAFWPEVRGYVHFPGPTGSYLKFMHMWIDPAHLEETGNAGQTTGVPGGMAANR